MSDIMGVGLDVGTMNIVMARRTEGKKVETRRVRDAFVDLDAGKKKVLKLSGVPFIPQKDGDGIIVVGDKAMEYANVFGVEARRPLSGGLISASEFDALEVLGVMIKNLLGKPQQPGEICIYSIPAAPVDNLSQDVIYHERIFERIITECGYRAISGNEAMAIIFAECSKDMFSGISISFGSGMCNIALAVNGIEGFSFSIARGGDWIDAGAARNTRSTSSRMCALKEQGIDLLNPVGREQEALAIFFKFLVEYCIDNIAEQFGNIRDRFALPTAIPLVVSGGSTMAKNFLPFFKECFELKRSKFPIQISEIRQASDPLNTVARGLLIQAIQEYEDDDE